MARACSGWGFTVQRFTEMTSLDVKGIGSQRVRSKINHDDKSTIWCRPTKVGVSVVLTTGIRTAPFTNYEVTLLADRAIVTDAVHGDMTTVIVCSEDVAT
jgi:hypothetical protein